MKTGGLGEAVIGIYIFGALLVVIVIAGVVSAVRKALIAKRRREEIAHRKSEFERIVAEITRNGVMDEVADCPILLQENESAVWVEKSTLFETRAVRRTRNYVTSSFQQWQSIATGWLVLTTKRLVFDGDAANRTIPLKKILSSSSINSGDEIHVASSSRQKEMAFSSRNSFLLSWLVNTLATQ